MKRDTLIGLGLLVAFLVGMAWAIWYRCERRAEMFRRYGYEVTAADVFWGSEPPVRLMDLEAARSAAR